MDTDKNLIIEVIIDCIKENSEADFNTYYTKYGNDLAIFGSDSLFDSIGLVNFIVALEFEILEKFEKQVSISDSKAFSYKHSPFRTINTLAEYIKERLEND